MLNTPSSCMLAMEHICWQSIIEPSRHMCWADIHSLLQVLWSHMLSWCTYAEVVHICWADAHMLTYADVRMLTYADVCWRMLMYSPLCWRMLPCADVCWRMLTYADVRWRIHTCADVCWRVLTCADVCWRMLTYAEVCWRMLKPADVCWRMLTYADDVCWFESLTDRMQRCWCSTRPYRPSKTNHAAFVVYQEDSQVLILLYMCPHTAIYMSVLTL